MSNQLPPSEADIVDNYWVGRENESFYSCPNVSLFRFIGHLKVNLFKQNVFEVGFGGNKGADLAEMVRRGAYAYGADINPRYVEATNIVPTEQLAVLRAGSEPTPFDLKFTLVYSRDTISYMSENELTYFCEDSHRILKDDGIFILQFIESDIQLENGLSAQNFEIKNFLKNHEKPISNAENPIRFWKVEDVLEIVKNCGFELVGSKTMVQSYDLQETTFRIDRYLAFQK